MKDLTPAPPETTPAREIALSKWRPFWEQIKAHVAPVRAVYAWLGRWARAQPEAPLKPAAAQPKSPSKWDEFWEEIKTHVRDLAGPTNKKLDELLKELRRLHQGRYRNFYKIEYEPGEAIVFKGTFSGYATLLLQGKILVPEEEPSARLNLDSIPDCWHRPLGRRLQNWALRHKEPRHVEKSASRWHKLLGHIRDMPVRAFAHVLLPLVRTTSGQSMLANPISETQARGLSAVKHRAVIPAHVPGHRQLSSPTLRFFGVTETIWNEPHPFTILADKDPTDQRPCQVLLVSRRALQQIIRACPGFYQAQIADFLAQVLPRRLADNDLFCNSLYAEDLSDAAWSLLLGQMREGDPDPAMRRVREMIGRDSLHWLSALSPGKPLPNSQQQIVDILNGILERRDLYVPDTWPEAALDDLAKALLRKGVTNLSRSELFVLNRRLVAAAFPGSIPTDDFHPVSDEEFRTLVKVIDAALPEKPLQLVRLKKGDTVYSAGDPATSLYLTMSGTLRITRAWQGEQMLVSHVPAHRYFGVSCIHPFSPQTEKVEALTAANLWQLEAAEVRALIEQYQAIKKKLESESKRLRSQEEAVHRGAIHPPEDPPQRIASKLSVAQNLLLIDMDLCTRCDQCVRACAEAHENRPRFHRANPDLRFGKWEVAKACVHCSDAPCQDACPVGAITFLDTDDVRVQIHRSRCIGCGDCVSACPFDVIEMLLPASPEDTAVPGKEKAVATKCDLCLTKHRDPPCVAACPYGAAQRGSLQELEPLQGVERWVTATYVK
jgi:Fe-S-cluster-containing hydrogenase component 2